MEHIKKIWGTLDPFVEPGPVIGRRVANMGFLDALLSADPFDAYHFFPPTRDLADRILAHVRARHARCVARVVLLPRTELPRRMVSEPYHCFHLSDCLTSQGWLAALRNRLAPHCFPVTGLTHSLSYARYGTAFAQHVWPGVTPRDCIVATSRAGEAVVRAELEQIHQAMPRSGMPSVATIPLGIWCRDFVSGPAADLEPNKLVILVPGRISPYSKMDLVPLLRAFQRLGGSGVDLRRFCVVLAGGSEEGASLPGVLKTLAANIGLRLRVVRKPDEATKIALLHRADVVVSLADNPQETFGLTLLEAQAAGKPVLASDYDGYRDLVEHGRTGFLVPTLDGGGDDLTSLLAPLFSDTTTHLWLAQDVAVDVGAVARFLERLLDAEERRRLGVEAARRAELFDWSRIIGRYVRLWDDLWLRAVPDERCTRHPLALDYARAFASYPSARLGDHDLLRITDLGRAVWRRRDYPVLYAGLEDRIDVTVLRKILTWARQDVSWGALRRRVAAEEEPRLRATVMWMLKGDMLERVAA